MLREGAATKFRNWSISIIFMVQTDGIKCLEN